MWNTKAACRFQSLRLFPYHFSEKWMETTREPNIKDPCGIVSFRKWWQQQRRRISWVSWVSWANWEWVLRSRQRVSHSRLQPRHPCVLPPHSPIYNSNSHNSFSCCPLLQASSLLMRYAPCRFLFDCPSISLSLLASPTACFHTCRPAHTIYFPPLPVGSRSNSYLWGAMLQRSGWSEKHCPTHRC